MDNILSFQKLIDYIEEHLTEEIDTNELAKILAVSEQSMQRIFVFLTNMSLAEYIKRRRFSKAYCICHNKKWHISLSFMPFFVILELVKLLSKLLLNVHQNNC